MRVAEVNSPLISVYDMINNDQRVVFDVSESYVEHKNTGQRIPITWHGHNPVMEFQVLEPDDEDLDVPMLADVDSPSGPGATTSSSSVDLSGSSRGSSSSFHRQAALP